MTTNDCNCCSESVTVIPRLGELSASNGDWPTGSVAAASAPLQHLHQHLCKRIDGQSGSGNSSSGSTSSGSRSGSSSSSSSSSSSGSSSGSSTGSCNGINSDRSRDRCSSSVCVVPSPLAATAVEEVELTPAVFPDSHSSFFTLIFFILTHLM